MPNITSSRRAEPIKLVNSKSNYKAELTGYLKVNENFDSFKIKKAYNYDKKTFLILI